MSDYSASYACTVFERKSPFCALEHARHRTPVPQAAAALCEHHGDFGINAVSSILPECMLEATVGKLRECSGLFPTFYNSTPIYLIELPLVRGMCQYDAGEVHFKNQSEVKCYMTIIFSGGTCDTTRSLYRDRSDSGVPKKSSTTVKHVNLVPVRLVWILDGPYIAHVIRY
ncbi:predicted protein [Postia placenta Mad-698-R]|nr:predicted protein [Postia placenta Mad-698-R]